MVGVLRAPIRRAVVGDRAGYCLLLVVALTTSAAVAADTVSFRHDVMAVLSKAGCNSGVCHGNLNGKGGFKLSLRGQDPEWDRVVLTRDQMGRRTNRVEPARSLILLKPTMQTAHEGGQRFDADSLEYKILHTWIADGLAADRADLPTLERVEVTPPEETLVEPAGTVQLRVEAFFSDGSSRDVTRLAVYEADNQLATVTHDGLVQGDEFGETTILVRFLQLQVPVRLAFVPARPDYVWSKAPEANFIDRHVFAKLRRLRMNPSAECSDNVYVRRAFLDLLGVLPTADKARSFVADTTPDKRAKLIDRLLDRPEFADFWALKWSDLLRNEEKVLDRKGVLNFHGWIRRGLVEGKPFDVFVRELIASRGSTYTNPPTNFYRALRDPLTRAESAAQLFLGTRVGCAKCHNHPFDRWTQDDYYGWAALFAGVRYKVLENRRRDNNDKHEFDGEQVVWIDRHGTIKDPRNGKPAAPRFLGAADQDRTDDRDSLEALAEWITRPDNPFFARAQVNRIWYHLMGRGIVDPIDDFRATNPPSHPALLDALAQEFVESRFDIRHMIRRIMNSSTYQRSAEPNETNAADETNYARARVRRLAAEPLLDAICQVTGVAATYNGYPTGYRAGQIAGVQAVRLRDKRPSSGDRFLKAFGKPARLLACECERSADTTLGQAFQLISGATINELLTRDGNRLDRLLASGFSDGDIIEELYWIALARPPGQIERERMQQYMGRAKDRRAALEDITWGLLNAKEFVLRQ